MNIEFPGQTANYEGGLSVRAVVGSKTVACLFTTDALQDVNPDTRFLSPLEQYERNKFELNAIAERLIREVDILSGPVRITSADVRV